MAMDVHRPSPGTSETRVCTTYRRGGWQWTAEASGAAGTAAIRSSSSPNSLGASCMTTSTGTTRGSFASPLRAVSTRGRRGAAATAGRYAI